MDPRTVDALNALNRAFYERVALEFHETRKAPWPGFGRVLSLLVEPPKSVLDIGAGDGRFAEYLRANLRTPFTYTGVDFSGPLLALARARPLGPQCGFVEADILDDAWTPEARFDLIVLLGVLHHVPSLALRKRLLAKLAGALAPGGTLVLTFWRLDEDPRFESRVVPYPQVPLEDLEPGDTFLRWGSAEGPPRYCHFADAAEVLALCDTTGLSTVARFRSDGRGDALNEYVVLRAAS